MKTLKIITVLILSISIISCRPSRNIIVHGTPGTTIHYATGHEYLGTIGEDGIAKIRIGGSSIDFQPFLLSKGRNSKKYIPFALNYKRGISKIGQRTIAFCSILFMGCAFLDETNTRDWKYLKHQTTNEDIIKE